MSKLKFTALSSNAVGALQWRLANLYFQKFGNIPLGQQLVQITLMSLHDRKWYPTVGQLARIVDMPRTTISRHISAIIAAGQVLEAIDPSDRRRRVLKPTKKGNRARESLYKHANALIARVAELDQYGAGKGERPIESLDDVLEMTDAARRNAVVVKDACK